LRPNEWLHVALSTGPAGMKLYVNGVLVGTNADTTSFAAINNGNQNLVGRGLEPLAPGLLGQLDEVRLWKVQRSAGQIRETLSSRLTGSEPDLFGLLKFDYPAQPGRDATPRAHHGRVVGEFTVVRALPTVL